MAPSSPPGYAPEKGLSVSARCSLESLVVSCVLTCYLVSDWYTLTTLRHGKGFQSRTRFLNPGFGIGEFLIPGSRRDYGIPAV